MNYIRGNSVNPHSGFTLVELLTVLFVMGAMISIAAPAFKLIGGEKGVKTEIADVAATMRSARQHAVLHNTYTYMVFVDDFSGVEPGHPYRAYAVMEGHQSAPTNYVTLWKTLHIGTYFCEEDDVKGGGWGVSATERDVMDVDATGLGAPYPGSDDGEETLPMVQFTPAGRCRIWDGTQWGFVGKIKLFMSPGFDAGEGIEYVEPEKSAMVTLHPRTGLLQVKL